MNGRRTLKLVIVCVTVLFLASAQAALAEKTVGRWCDRMIPNMPKYNHIMTIVVKDDGKIELRSKFGDGSSSKSELKKVDSRTFAKIGSSSGDRYRIKEGSGELQLLDNDGPIRVAKPLGKTPKSGECK